MLTVHLFHPSLKDKSVSHPEILCWRQNQCWVTKERAKEMTRLGGTGTRHAVELERIQEAGESKGQLLGKGVWNQNKNICRWLVLNMSSDGIQMKTAAKQIMDWGRFVKASLSRSSWMLKTFGVEVHSLLQELDFIYVNYAHSSFPSSQPANQSLRQ